MRAWQHLTSRVVVDSPWVRVRLNSFALPNGRRIPEYYIIERPDSAVCVCCIGMQVLLVHQYRPEIEKDTLCHPGGRLEATDCSPVDGALRELLEETGLSPKAVSELGAFAQIPAVETGRVHMFLVECEAAPPKSSNPDTTEDIATELVPIAKLEELIAAGDMDCVACVAASYKLLLMTESPGQRQ